jgi:RNA polymerase sigma factor (sigma-70 family)
MDWETIYERLTRDRRDEGAWAALEWHVRRWACAALGRRAPHAVDDAVADVCASVFVALSAARGGGTFSAFVYGYFLNARRRLLRLLDEPGVSIEGIDVPVPDWGDDDDDPTEEELAALQRALDGLPERERRAVTLRYLDGQGAAAIARRLGVSEANARRIVCRGLARLRRTLTESPPGELGLGGEAVVRSVR